MQIHPGHLALTTLLPLLSATVIIVPPLTLHPYPHPNCNSPPAFLHTLLNTTTTITTITTPTPRPTISTSTPLYPLHPRHEKLIQAPLGTCLDVLYFESYRALSTPRTDCGLYTFEGAACTGGFLIDYPQGECVDARGGMDERGAVGRGKRSVLYTCEL